MSRIVDLMELTVELGIPVIDINTPDGRVVHEAVWSAEDFSRALERILPVEAGEEILLTSSPQPWVTLALCEALRPAEAKYLYVDRNGIVMEMGGHEFDPGEENYDLKFEIIEGADGVYMNMNSDRPEAELYGTGHTFDKSKLPLVRVPRLPAGRDVYIHAKGMFCVMVSVARCYVDTASSVWLCSHGDDYRCAVSNTPEHHPGEVKKRVIENRL